MVVPPMFRQTSTTGGGGCDPARDSPTRAGLGGQRRGPPRPRTATTKRWRRWEESPTRTMTTTTPPPPNPLVPPLRRCARSAGRVD